MAEFNLIQNPELLRRLQAVLGIRQAHIAPALNEGVTPVVLLADLQREPEYTVATYSARATVDGNLVDRGGGAILNNPAGSTIVARVLRATIAIATDVFQHIAAEVTLATTDPPGVGTMDPIATSSRGLNWERGNITGARRSSLTLYGGTLTAINNNMFDTNVDSTRVGGICRLEIDFEPYRVHLDPGTMFRIGYEDNVPAGIVTLLWEERPFEPRPPV